MKKPLYIGFKGIHNASSSLATALSEHAVLLTNSFAGVKRDMDCLDAGYDPIVLFGIDPQLKNAVRIEHMAKMDGISLSSVLDLQTISSRLTEVGLANTISDTPTHFLCNEAYWLALQKSHGKAVFFHIPSFKNMTKEFFEQMKAALS